MVEELLGRVAAGGFGRPQPAMMKPPEAATSSATSAMCASFSGPTPEAILHAADMAMYRAMQEAKGSFRFSVADVNGEHLASRHRRGTVSS